MFGRVIDMVVEGEKNNFRKISGILSSKFVKRTIRQLYVFLKMLLAWVSFILQCAWNQLKHCKSSYCDELLTPF